VLESDLALGVSPLWLPPRSLDASPVLPPDILRAMAKEILELSTADTMSVYIDHTATGVARVARGRVRLQESGSAFRIYLVTRFGHRAEVTFSMDQFDRSTLRQAVRYLDQLARTQSGDPISLTMPALPRVYGPNTTWHDATARALASSRHAAVPALIIPVLDAGFAASGMIGVYAHSTVFANTEGLMVSGQETDAELAVTAWSADGKGAGWAGQTSRDWTTLRPDAIARRAIHLAERAANPVAYEPGRYTTILDRPAVVQLVNRMGEHFDAHATFERLTALFNTSTLRPKLNEPVVDQRITLSSNPNDPDGGYLPFNYRGDPLIPMTWVDRGIHTNLAYSADYAAAVGYAPPNDAPTSLRMDNVSRDTPTSVEEMIASCRNGIYVNRLAYVGPTGDLANGLLSGVTAGGCFLIRNGKIEKAIKNLRFLDSPWFFLNRLEAIGTPERASFGYAPWAGGWPVTPTIVPPLMIRDFNFTATADNV